MFSNLKPTFGSTTNTSFGFSSNVAPNPFGQSAFGKAPTTVFGQPSTAFGATTAPLFGQANNQHGSMFSSATPSSFGQTVTAQPTFGSAMFGSTPAQPSSSGLFGAGATSTFGQQAKTPSFGFGSNSASTTGFFGQPQPAVQPTAQPSGLFGQSTTNLFGTNTGFGASSSNTQIGTAIKFTPVTGTDTMVKGSINQTISTRHHCITCMKEYEGKSLEELRWEDYQVNRKGPQQGAQQSTGLFGTMAPSVGGGLFGTNPVATSSTTLFGQQDNKVFGSPGTTGFGQANTFGATSSASSIPGGLFGKPLTGFGASTSSTSTFPFSSTAQPAPLFGTPTPSKTFGVQSQPSSIFGQSPGFTQPTFGGFGAQQNQNVALFNQNKPAPFNLATSTSSTFGSFGQPTQLQNPSLFSGAKTNTGFGGFGVTTTAPVFGQSSFGQPQQGGLFNTSFNKAPAPLFGQTNTTNTLGTGLSLGPTPSLFGNIMSKPNPMFGQNIGMFNTGFGTSATTTPFNMGGAIAQTGATAADQNQAQTEQQIISMSATPYGLPQLLSNINELDVDVKDSTRATNPTELNALLNSVNKCHTSPSSEKLNPVQVYGRKTPMFDGLEHRDDTLLSNVRIKNNPKRLVIRNKSIKAILEPPSDIQPTHEVEMLSLARSRSSIFPDDVSMPTVYSEGSSKHLLDSSVSSRNLITDQQISKSTPIFDLTSHKAFNLPCGSLSESTIGAQMTSTKIIFEDLTHLEESDSKEDEGETFTEAVESQEWDTEPTGLVDKQVNLTNSMSEASPELNNSAIAHPAGIILTRPEYYTVPLLDELTIAEDGTCVVQGFTVGRLGYGNVCFPEAIDVSNINIDELVHFRHKEITIYPDDTKKPPVGQGLNRRAQITLDKVWPMDKKAKEHVTDVDSLMKIDYAGKLRRLCDKQNTRFVEYRPDTGSWVFRVDHFSKYGHPDSDDEEEETAQEKIESEKLLKTLKLKQVQQGTATDPLETQEQLPQKQSDISEIQHTLLSRPDEPMPYAGDMGEKKTSNGQIQDFLNIRELSNLNYNAGIDVDDTDDYIGMDNYSMMSPSGEFSKYSLMKSAFFEGIVPDYDDSESDICSSEGGILELSNYVSKMSPTGNKMDDLAYDQTLMLDIFEEELKYPLKEEPECLQLPAQEEEKVIELDTSVNNYNVADLVAFKGQSYRVGWGRNMSFLCLGSKNSSADDDENEIDVKNNLVPLPLRFVTINRITNLNHTVFRNCLDDHLKCQFKSSKVEFIDEMPYFTTVPGFKLLQDHQKVSTKSAYEQQIWNLCATLWNEISPEELLKFDTRTIRKRLFSSWLKSATNDTVAMELDGDQNSMYYKILTHISGHHIKEASELALKTDNYNLSLLISQLPSNTTMRSCLVKQIIQWNECNTFKYVDSNLWKIYSLLAGEPYVDYGENSICAYEGMDWLRILGMYFWYIIVPGETVSFAVNLYESIFEEHVHTIKPRPDYKNAPNNVYDLRFELLKFYSDNGYSLTRVLNPATYTKDALDHRFSWLLLQTLISLNYGDISKQAKTHVHTQFAAQLEQMGLWHWAIFVLLFIEDTQVRKVLVKDMLGRHVQLFSAKWDDYPAREKMVVNDFKIPEIWINSSKADLAILQKNYKEAIFYLCYSTRWEEAHSLMMEHLVPDHFLYYEYDILINILTPLWDNQEYLPDWEERGGLMYDFAKLAVQYNEMLIMSETEIIRDELVIFRAALMSICNRFQTFNPETYMHDVCLGEMSARIMMMLRKLLFAIEGITENVCSDIARNAQSLAMTGDYLQQELNEILVDFISIYQQRVDH